VIDHDGRSVRDVRVSVGGSVERAETDLGTIAANEAARYLLAIAPRLTGDAANDAIMGAAIAPVKSWPTMIEIARDNGASESARKASLFWVAQEAGAAAIAGLDAVARGEVTVGERTLPRERPDLAVGAGIGVAPEERKSQGLWLDWSQVRNVTIADLPRLGRGPFTDAAAEHRAAAAQLRALAVRPDDPLRAAGELSGGNQQKLVLARWLVHASSVLLLDEPTRGVDVGARAEVYRVIGELAGRGLAIVMVSSELAELVGFCDRILVMREGAVVGELRGETATEEQILRHALRTGPEAGSDARSDARSEVT
jgi:ribose transport system ATP-binding protein